MQPSRRIGLLLAALLVPCVILAVLGYRMVRQDGELAERRAVEQQRQEVDQIRKTVLAELEELKIRTMAGQTPADVVIVQPERFQPPADDPEIQAGEAAEFQGNNPLQAVEHYRRALAAAGQPDRSAYARSLLARALQKSGDTRAAQEQWRILLTTPLEITDDSSVPFAFYAGERLKQLPPGALNHLDQFSPVALEFLKDLTTDPRVTERISWLEQVKPIADQLRTLAGQYPLQKDWTTFGDPPWLAGATADDVLIAIPASRVLPELDPEGIELGPELPGLKAKVSPPQPVKAANLVLLYSSLGLAVIVTLLSIYLLWRDTRREAAMADLRSQFVSSVSHELKTPLTSIRMFAETLLLRGSRDQESSGEYLHTIVQESERLSRLVDNVLDFSKLERGDRKYRFEDVSLGDVIRAAERTMQYPLSQTGFRLSVDTDPAIPSVRADRDALEQAVLNLLTNAMKYSGEARDIHLRLRREKADAIIEVEDHGLGISKEHQQRIFERFFRAPAAGTETVPGAGLGLTLAAQTARAHSGSVSVRSEPGKGSIFTVRIPLATEAT